MKILVFAILGCASFALPAKVIIMYLFSLRCVTFVLLANVILMYLFSLRCVTFGRLGCLPRRGEEPHPE